MSALFADQNVEIHRPQGVGDVDVCALVSDSRRVRPGCLFAALAGTSQDGHTHIYEATQHGASAILCERSVQNIAVTQVLAADTRLALAKAARQFYDDPSRSLVMVGITGTNGKTTTAHLVEALLRGCKGAVGIIGTLGARYDAPSGSVEVATGLTTPDSIALLGLLADMRQAGVQNAVMEVSSHAIVQQRVAGVSYDVGVFTNLTHDHLDYHGTLEAYFAAKTRLLTERLKADGRAVLNLDDPWVASLVNHTSLRNRCVGFSSAGHASAVVVAEEIQSDAQGIRIRGRVHQEPFLLNSALVGTFNVENLLAAISVGAACEIPLDKSVSALESVGAVSGRFERVSGVTGPLVLVDYAHTPDALQKALLAARSLCTGNLLCVFGCGGDRDADKRAPMGRAAALADRVWLTNDNPRSEDPAQIVRAVEMGLRDVPPSKGYEVIYDRREAIAAALDFAADGDVVLIAGKGHESYQIIGNRTFHFDDRQEVRQLLAHRQATKEAE
ncbi:MAG: UDP-N-acetylmuramoyl-L-alanyl-D-glutamate--2,6-diaminopimelate ligase [Myxococcota bacterium]